MAIVKTLIVKGVARFLTDAYMSTIRSGIWNGSTIQVGYGGTGVTSAKGNLYTPVFLSSSGIAACSVEIPHATKDFKINGKTYAVFTNSTESAPTIYAPTGLAGTGGYILATNAAKNGLEWVAKPAANVTTTAVVAAAADGTTQISSAQSNPFYNLLEGGSVTRSIQFKAGTGITISASTGGVITITNSAPDVNHNTDHRKAFYGTCDTAAATAAKVVAISDVTGWELRAGIIIGVKFTNTNSASNVTLAVNSEAAKSIFYNNAAYTGSSADICGNAGRLTYYMYDGTYWVYIGNSYIINTSYSTMSLDEITTGTATSLRVMTAKIINDWLHTKAHTVGATWTHSTNSFANGLIVERSGSTNAAAIQFKNSNGILGYIGMSASANGGLLRWNTDTSINYLVADSGNISNKEATIGTSLTTIATIAGVDITAKIGSYAASNHTHSVTINGSTKTIAAPGGTAVNLGSYLPLSGGTMVGTISASNDSLGGGGFHNGYANIILRGNTTTGTSGIIFSSSKGDTSINRPSDCAFIQFLPYGVSAATAVGTNPTINTSGEAGRFVIGIHNDSGDLLWLQTSGANDLKHVVGANVYAIADAGNISNKAATIGTSLTTIATIAGVNITAKIPNVTAQAVELVSVEKTLAVSTWTDMAAVSTYSGTYAIQISDGTLYASGTFSVCGGTDAIIDEIPLHVSSTGATWRPYARISAGQLQMTTNEATGTARTYTIKILKLI